MAFVFSFSFHTLSISLQVSRRFPLPCFVSIASISTTVRRRHRARRLHSHDITFSAIVSRISSLTTTVTQKWIVYCKLSVHFIDSCMYAALTFRTSSKQWSDLNCNCEISNISCLLQATRATRTIRTMPD